MPKQLKSHVHMAFNLYLLKMRFRDFMSSIKEINFRFKCSLSIMFVCQAG